MVGDRFGVRSLLVAGSLASLGAVVVAALATDLILVYVAIAIAGLVSMLIVADITMVLDTAPESRRPAYMAALNLILGPLSLPAPLILGLLVDVAGFRMMFTIAIALALIGLAAALSFALRPPRTVEAGP
jgi:MFS family permease